jgi:oxalate decarboxylase/phosphoglucose isomerase-like protein (cupin superfamily)
MNPISLEHTSGLPIQLSGERILMQPGMSIPEYQEKHYQDWNEFFKEEPIDKATTLYYIYRNVHLLTHQELFVQKGLRYDITHLPATTVGKEALHTAGHIHKPNTHGVPFPECYEVLYGTGTFLLQDNHTHHVYTATLTQGEHIIIPGNVAHITINADLHTPLIVANIFTNTPDASDYTPIQQHNGAAWVPYIQEEKIVFEKNDMYTNEYTLQQITAQPTAFHLTKDPIYTQYIQHPEIFDFLSSPEKYTQQLDIAHLFSL